MSGFKKKVKEPPLICAHEYESHLKDTFEIEHFEEGNFSFNKNALMDGLLVIQGEAIWIEDIIRNLPFYFEGKLEMLQKLRKLQVVAQILNLSTEGAKLSWA